MKETGDSRYIYQNELDKAYFQHDMGYGDFKDLTRIRVAEKVLPTKHDGCQRGLGSMVYKLFDKITSGGAVKNEIMSNKELAEELHNPIIRKFEKRKVQLSFIDNIWGTDVADMQLISKFNKGFRLLFCFIDIYSKYVWVIPLKDKTSTTITNAFQNFLEESK